MAAYREGIAQGADYIEPDLVMTKDGVLVCRHENDISGTTDIAAHAQFASRRATRLIEGVEVEGWFVEDFTLAELQSLRCRERLPALRPGNIRFDGAEPIPTFASVLDLAASAGVGVYPELKHPTYLAALGLDPVPALVATFRSGGGQAAADRAFVQCFEVGPLQTLARMSSLRWRCIQLMSATGGPWDRPGLTYEAMRGDAGLAAVAAYARGIGVEKDVLTARFVARAHAAGLTVHGWTYRPENAFLPEALRRGVDPAAHGDLQAELRAAHAAGIDGVFCDLPSAAVAAIRGRG